MQPKRAQEGPRWLQDGRAPRQPRDGRARAPPWMMRMWWRRWNRKRRMRRSTPPARGHHSFLLARLIILLIFPPQPPLLRDDALGAASAARSNSAFRAAWQPFLVAAMSLLCCCLTHLKFARGNAPPRASTEERLYEDSAEIRYVDIVRIGGAGDLACTDHSGECQGRRTLFREPPIADAARVLEKLDGRATRPVV